MRSPRAPHGYNTAHRVTAPSHTGWAVSGSACGAPVGRSVQVDLDRCVITERQGGNHVGEVRPSRGSRGGVRMGEEVVQLARPVAVSGTPETPDQAFGDWRGLRSASAGHHKGMSTFWNPTDEDQAGDPVMALWRMTNDTRAGQF